MRKYIVNGIFGYHTACYPYEVECFVYQKMFPLLIPGRASGLVYKYLIFYGQARNKENNILGIDASLGVIGSR